MTYHVLLYVKVLSDDPIADAVPNRPVSFDRMSEAALSVLKEWIRIALRCTKNAVLSSIVSHFLRGSSTLRQEGRILQFVFS
jgi:hypothetical protein